jgi:hypothetical protein
MIKNIYRKITAPVWNIGFVENWQKQLSSGIFNVIPMNHDFKDRWFADPFILNTDEEYIYLLAEEYVVSQSKGRIVKLIIKRNNYRLVSTTVVLELDTHLSFPAIIKDNGSFYFYPESAHNGKLTLYKYNEKSCSAEEDSTLSNNSMTDGIIVKYNDNCYLFSTDKKTDGKYMQLNVYQSDSWNGQYVIINKILFSENCARNAGNWFQLDGELIRPAQDCTRFYGNGIVFQEVSNDNGNFEFKNIKKMYPYKNKWKGGIHTFNTFNTLENTAVVDICNYIRFASLLLRLRHLLK